MYGNGIGTGVLTTAGGIGGVSISGNSSSVIREATDAVQKAQSRVEQVIAQLRSTNDEAFGSVPTPTVQGSPGKDIPPASSKSDALRRATSALHEALNYLESEANRLGQL